MTARRLRPRPSRDWLVWVIVLSAVLALVGLFDMARNIGQPFGGYISYRRAQLPVGEIDVNTPVWWPGITGDDADDPDHLEVGDLLIAANGQPYYPGVSDVFAAAAARGDAQVRVQALRDGDVLALNVPVLTFTIGDFLDVRLPDIITALSFWLLAVIVYRAQPDAAPNRAFALAAAAQAASRGLYVHTVFLDDTFSNVVEALMLSVTVLMPATVVYLALNFPTPVRSRLSYLVYPAAVLGAIGVAAAVLSRLPWLPPDGALSRLAFERTAYFITVGVFLVAFALLVSRFIWLFRHRNRSRRQRRVLMIVVAGLLFAVPVILGSLTGGLVVGGSPVYYVFYGLDLRYGQLGVPLAFAYVLIRYQAMRAPSKAYIFVMVLASSAIVASLGAFVWTLTQTDWPFNDLRPPFASLFIVGLVMGTAWAAAIISPRLLGRFFNKDRVTVAESLRFSRHLSGHVSGQTESGRLPETIVTSLADDLQLEQTAIWLRDDDRPALVLADQAGEARVMLPAELPLGPDADAPVAPVHLHRRADLPGWLQPLAVDCGLDVAVPLYSGGRLIGLAALGPRWDEEIFDEHALYVAELVGQQAALYLTAARTMDELRQVPGHMANVQERERQRLAQELHDTIQQFLGRLPFYLAVSRDSIRKNPAVAAEILEQSIADVEAAAVAVRQIRHNLAPSQLERGLVTPLTALTRHFEDRTHIRVALRADGDVDPRTTLETRHALYRVVQQALDNVEAHAAAERVTVSVAPIDGRVLFSVHDDGRGSSAAERELARQRGSFGLESMRARLEAAGGGFTLLSTPGFGTEVSGWVPAGAALAPADEPHAEPLPAESSVPANGRPAPANKT